MEKKLKLSLNNYNPLPASLTYAIANTVALPELTVNLATLYHHYFMDCHDRAPPNPDPAHFEHAQFLLPTEEFRFQGDGLGATTSIRRNRSTELGQAFCRWFLYEHLGVTYFAHVEKMLRRQAVRRFEGCSLNRIADGDGPDYLCLSANDEVCLAEAKGSYAAISFKNKAFETWRQQFTRVAFQDRQGKTRRLKGHIVATRFATERDSDRLKTTLFAEDPYSPGEQDFDRDYSGGLAQATRAAHYANIARKIRQPILASALQGGVPMPVELFVGGIVWEVVFGPLQGKHFVGGYFSSNGEAAFFERVNDDQLVFEPARRLRLDLPQFTFFGLELGILEKVVAMARRASPEQATRLPVFEATEFFDSGFSVLRDGSALAPLDYFRPVRTVRL